MKKKLGWITGDTPTLECISLLEVLQSFLILHLSSMYMVIRVNNRCHEFPLVIIQGLFSQEQGFRGHSMDCGASRLFSFGETRDLYVYSFIAEYNKCRSAKILINSESKDVDINPWRLHRLGIPSKWRREKMTSDKYEKYYEYKT